MSARCRQRHFSRRTEEAYRYWIRAYILFHNKQHPRTLGVGAVAPFINHLAIARHVAASTQSQALNALIFLYRDVLQMDVGYIDGLRRVQRLPVVLTVEEVRDIFRHLHGVPRLIAELLYGAGLRVTECMTLRVKDLDFRSGVVTVRDGKGGKDRTTLLPERLLQPLQRHLLTVITRYKAEVRQGRGHVPLPGALDRKYPRAAQSVAWQFVFPSAVVRPCPETSKRPGRDSQARQCPYLTTFLRHSPFGARHRHPHDPVAVGPQEPGDHHDLYARPPSPSKNH